MAHLLFSLILAYLAHKALEYTVGLFLLCAGDSFERTGGRLLGLGCYIVSLVLPVLGGIVVFVVSAFH